MTTSLASFQGRFDDPVLVPVKMQTVGLPWYRQIGVMLAGRKYVLRDDWYFLDSKDNICMIPGGMFKDIHWRHKLYQFITDGTSWPRIVHIFFDRMGLGLVAALAHDFGMRYQCFLNTNGEVIRHFDTRKAIDDEYRLIDIRVNDMTWLSNVKRVGVWAGSWWAWNRYRNMPSDQTDARLLLENR